MTKPTRGQRTTKKVIQDTPPSTAQSLAGSSSKPRPGDKVKVIANCFPYMESFVGRTGAVEGSITDYCCTVKLKGGLIRWFDYRELEML